MISPQVDELEGQLSREKRRSVAAQRESIAKDQPIEALQREREELRRAVLERERRSSELESEVRELTFEREALQAQVGSERKRVVEEKAKVGAAVAEATAASDHCQALLAEVARQRDETKHHQRIADQARINASHEVQGYRDEASRLDSAAKAERSLKLQAEEQVAALQERVEALEEQAQKERARASRREKEHAEALESQRRQERLLQRELDLLAQRHAAAGDASALDVLAAQEAIVSVGAAFDEMRADVAMLQTENECLMAEMSQQAELVTSVFELRFTARGAAQAADQLVELQREIVGLLSLQEDTQRMVDMQSDALDDAHARLAEAAAFADGTVQPLAEAAAHAVAELPLLEAELETACLQRGTSLAELRVVRETAEDEAQRFCSELATVTNQYAKDQEAAAFAKGLLTSQLEKLQGQFAEASEELEGWRSGSIRLANHKQWRESRERGDPPVGEAGAAHRRSISVPTGRAGLEELAGGAAARPPLVETASPLPMGLARGESRKSLQSATAGAVAASAMSPTGRPSLGMMHKRPSAHLGAALGESLRDAASGALGEITRSPALARRSSSVRNVSEQSQALSPVHHRAPDVPISEEEPLGEVGFRVATPPPEE